MYFKFAWPTSRNSPELSFWSDRPRWVAGARLALSPLPFLKHPEGMHGLPLDRAAPSRPFSERCSLCRARTSAELGGPEGLRGPFRGAFGVAREELSGAGAVSHCGSAGPGHGGRLRMQHAGVWGSPEDRV